MAFPEIPQDLDTLSDAELSALLDEILAFSAATQDAASGKFTNEQVADLTRAADGADAVRSELAARVAAEADRDAAATAALARLNPPTPDPEPEIVLAVEAPVVTAAARPAKPAAVKVPAVARREPMATPPLSAIADTVSAVPSITAALRPPTTITAGADIPGIRAGETLGEANSEGMLAIADALLRRSDAFRGSSQSGTEFVTVASLHSNMPDDRKLLAGSENANMALITSVTGPTAIKAAGGLCAPVTPYYDIMVLAETDRPVRDALPSFDASRGGIRLIPPPSFSAVQGQARTVADGVTNSTTTVTSATANFNSSYDVGATIAGSGIPASTIITNVVNSTTVLISNAATLTASGVSLTITRPGAAVWIPDTVDAAMLNGTATQLAAGIKPCLHVTCPGVSEVHVGSVPACLEFGNLTARAYPEQVVAWLKLVIAWQSRVADSQLLTTIGTGSVQVTHTQVLGTAVNIPAVIGKAAAYYRNHNRMNPDTPLRCFLPVWTQKSGAIDLMMGEHHNPAFYQDALQTFKNAFLQFNVNVTFYWDSGTGQGQLMNAGAAQGAGALTAFPTTAVGYLFAEGSWIFVDGGTLDLGVVRDSVLNSQNSYRVFQESFENVVFVGLESLAITMTVATNGTTSLSVTAPAGF